MKIIIKLFLLFLAFVFVGCASVSQTTKSPNAPKQDLVIGIGENFSKRKVSILAVGDNLIHDTLYYQASARANGQGYDFEFPYQSIEEYIKQADIAIINQETPLASDLYPLSNYPRFNSPKEVGAHMVQIGFDVFNHANNHIYDMGADGLKATLDFWDTKENILAVGAYRNQQEKDEIKYLEKDGLKIAFLGFTQHTNGLDVPVDSTVGVVKTSDKKEIKKQIQNAKASCDIVIVNVHWGDEGSAKVNENQKSLARDMAGWGADLIIGHHPHVLQGGEYITKADGTKAYVFYSLGNFISAQSRPENMAAGMLLVEFRQNEYNEPPHISNINFIPTVTHYGNGMSNIRIIPFENYTKELAGEHGVRIDYKDFGYEYLKKMFQNISTEDIKNT